MIINHCEIKINKSNNNHVEFKNLRDFENRDYKEFWKMLKGIFNKYKS